MDLKINNYNKTKNNYYKPAFKGPVDGVATSILKVLDTNEMANAVLLDVGAMVLPRSYIDTKKRNKYAGTETFFREICGTIINCLAAGFLGGIIAKIANKILNPETKINPKSWYSDDSLNVLKIAHQKSNNNTNKFVETIFDNMQGKDGHKTVKFQDIKWNEIEWFEENKWNNFKWDNKKYTNVQDKLKTKNEIIKTFTEVIQDKNLTTRDKKNIFEILETRLTNALKVNRNIEIKIDNKQMNATLNNILRDTYDMGHDILNANNINIEKTINKIQKVNKIKIFGALTLASAIGISVQKINRKITEKRTGKKGFAGETDYMTRGKNQTPKDTKNLLFNKILASIGIIAMTIGVMKVKNPKDFVKKLQFTGPISTGNAIKTVYGATIAGRFMASDSNTELRESVIRDYFGFLNWLVLGGFAAKGIANLLDKNQKSLFNIHKEGKGLKHWLNDISLKTHAEIAAHGKDFAKKNIWKLNTAHIAGLAYSTIALGIILPLINIKMTNHKNKNNKINNESK